MLFSIKINYLTLVFKIYNSMKTFNVIMSVLAFAAIVNAAAAQTYIKDTKTSFENLQNNTSLFNIVAAQDARSVVLNNTIRVQQVGDYNSANSLTRSNSSDIQLTQIGNRNEISLAIYANKISEDVLQIGDNHSFTDFSINPTNLHSTNVLQYGTNQNLIKIGGQNSISDKMMISMKGRNQTVIIRNIKN